MNQQGELFPADEPPAAGSVSGLVPGLLQRLEAVTPAEEAELSGRIDAAPLAPFAFGPWQGKRLTTHYGSGYDFSRHRLDDAPAMPPWLVELRERVAPLAGLTPEALQAALLIRYDPGAGIGWHRDRPQYGDVVGLSLGAPAVLRLRRRTGSGFERREMPLPPRSLYRLSAEVRWEWEHSIVPLDQTRRSITFRTLRDGGDRLASRNFEADQSLG